MNFRKASLLFLLLIVLTFNGKGQRISLGGGFFGETVTHPGFIGDIESERRFSDKIALSLRLDLGFYHHPGNNDVFFADISHGFRRYYLNGLFLEQYVGVGTMAVYYNEEVWHIDANGNAVQVSGFGNFYLMPSVSSGLGYVLSRHSEHPRLIWLRPKIFWQIPFNNKALPHFALQAGCTFPIAPHEKIR